MSLETHCYYLGRALEQARLGRGSCAPNPAVGAVVVKEGTILATGYHRGPGLPHAEADALSKLGDEAKGATLYVTLEPCCHFGRTPPCSRLVLERGIRNVVYAYEDPNPVVAGKGALEIRTAGVSCDQLALSEVDTFYRSYAYWTKSQRPWVTAKLALSLDGKIAGPGGARVQLTSEPLQKLTHEGRRAADAILTTARTVNADNPRLDVRLREEPERKVVYVLEGDEKIRREASLFSTAKRVEVVHGDLSEIVERIGRDGVHDLWVEAGGALFESLVKAKLVQRALLYVAPKWLGREAQSAFSENVLAGAKSFRWSGHGPDGLCEVEF